MAQSCLGHCNDISVRPPRLSMGAATQEGTGLSQTVRLRAAIAIHRCSRRLQARFRHHPSAPRPDAETPTPKARKSMRWTAAAVVLCLAAAAQAGVTDVPVPKAPPGGAATPAHHWGGAHGGGGSTPAQDNSLIDKPCTCVGWRRGSKQTAAGLQ